MKILDDAVEQSSIRNVCWFLPYKFNGTYARKLRPTISIITVSELRLEFDKNIITLSIISKINEITGSEMQGNEAILMVLQAR